MEIKKTKNYKMFKYIKGNRGISKTHLKNLAFSINRRNLLEENPILVNEKYEVIDGQHRLEVAKRQELPIYYIVVKEGDLKIVQLLNSALRAWKLEDFLESFIAVGNKHYKKIKNYIEKYSLPISTALILLKKDVGWAEALDLFRAGDFEVDNLVEAESIGDQVAELRKKTDFGIITSTDFTRAVVKICKLEKYDHKRMQEKIALGGRFKKQASQRDYWRELERVYNFKNKSGFWVRFF